MSQTKLFVHALLLSSTLAAQAQTDPLGYIQTVAGNGDLSALSPFALGVDRVGTLSIAEADHNLGLKLTRGGSLQAFAGNANPGDSGDDGLASVARLAALGGVAVGGAGNIYIADTANHAIRRVTPDGVIHHFAGSGSPGFDGDGGPARSASLFLPGGLALDGGGNLYIAGYPGAGSEAEGCVPHRVLARLLRSRRAMAEPEHRAGVRAGGVSRPASRTPKSCGMPRSLGGASGMADCHPLPLAPYFPGQTKTTAKEILRA